MSWCLEAARRHYTIQNMHTFIHVGCGPKRKHQTTRGFNTPEWNEVRFDIDPFVQPDVQGTMTDMAAVATGSMNALYSSHNIEHLYPHEVPVALKEFVRVLSADGFVVLTCPDLQSVCELVWPKANSLRLPTPAPPAPLPPSTFCTATAQPWPKATCTWPTAVALLKRCSLAPYRQQALPQWSAAAARPRFSTCGP